MTDLMNFLAQVPVECLYGAGSFVLAVIVAGAHARGYRVPLVEKALDRLLKAQRGEAAPEPVKDEKSGPTPSEELLEAFKQLAMRDIAPDHPVRKFVDVLLAQK